MADNSPVLSPGAPLGDLTSESQAKAQRKCPGTVDGHLENRSSY